MAETRPVLSICVPSRNRQDTLCKTILGLIANPRPDVQFVIVDNSDDPAVMAGFVAQLPADPRLVFLPADPVVHSMRANWARAMPLASGRFVTFIGDDDHVEPDVADIIVEIVRRAPETEVVAWSRMTYSWPEIREEGASFFLSLKNNVHVMPRAGVIRSMFNWQTNTHVPSCPFTVYHGAVARVALDRVRDLFGGVYFEHTVLDYDNAIKLMFSARGFAYVDRPMSVLGVSGKSNSAVIGHYDKIETLHTTFAVENGDLETAELIGDFPFVSRLGVAGSIMALQHWFKTKYDKPFAGWEPNFVKAMQRECEMSRKREEFDRQVAACRQALARYEGGRWAGEFNPVFVDRTGQIPFCGFNDGFVIVREAIGGQGTPAEAYRIVKQMLPEPGALDYLF